MHPVCSHCTVDMRTDTCAFHKLLSLSPCASKRHTTRSTLELLELISGSGALVDGLVLCGLSCERRAAASAESAEGVEG